MGAKYCDEYTALSHISKTVHVYWWWLDPPLAAFW